MQSYSNAKTSYVTELSFERLGTASSCAANGKSPPPSHPFLGVFVFLSGSGTSLCLDAVAFMVYRTRALPSLAQTVFLLTSMTHRDCSSGVHSQGIPAASTRSVFVQVPVLIPLKFAPCYY